MTYRIETRDGIILVRNLHSTREALRWCIENRVNSSSIYIKKENE